MSQFTTIAIMIYDLEVLLKTLSLLGYKYSLGKTKIKGYKGISTNVDLAIKIKGQKNIGFIKKDNSYHLIADWWHVNKESSISQDEFMSNLKQTYAYEKVLSEAKKNKWLKVTEEKMSDETIKLVFTA